MKRKAIYIGLSVFLALSTVLTGCGKNAKSSTETAIDTTEYKASAVANSESAKILAENVKYKDIENTDNVCEIKLNGKEASISSAGASIDNGVITISSAGTYKLSGDFNGKLQINAGDDDKVYIILNGVNITSDDYAPFVVENADKVIIHLTENTTNTFTDSESYTVPDGMTEDDLPTAAIYSKCDLGFSGTGKLVVNANCNDGITSKKDIWFNSGEYEITSADDGIVGKKSVAVKTGTFTITSKGDGIKSTEAENAEKGFISIENGTFNITAENDGIQAETYLYIKDGTFNITTAGGSANANSKDPRQDFKNNFSGQPDMQNDSDGGQISTVSTQNDADSEQSKSQNDADSERSKPQNDADSVQPYEENTAEQTQEDSSESTSTKGIKAGNDITVLGGKFDIDSMDDAFHSNSTMTINAGTLNVATGDDGFHADEVLVMSGGDITISKSYEGIESDVIVIEGGNIDVTSSDDGLNAANGLSTGSMDPNDTSNSTSALYITGGKMVVNADGDGIDSNGTVSMSGGDVTVYGPENDGNGFFDYDISFTITGGQLAAAGSSGMLQSTSEESSQAGMAVVLDESYESGTEVTVKDSSGNVVAQITPVKSFNTVMFSNSSLKQGEKYEIFVNGESSKTITMSSASVIDGYEGMGGGMPGGMNNNGEAPQMPSGASVDIQNGQPPQMPDGEMPQKPSGDSVDIQNGQPPQMPDGETPQKPSGEPPQMKDGSSGQQKNNRTTQNK